MLPDAIGTRRTPLPDAEPILLQSPAAARFRFGAKCASTPGHYWRPWLTFH